MLEKPTKKNNLKNNLDVEQRFTILNTIFIFKWLFQKRFIYANPHMHKMSPRGHTDLRTMFLGESFTKKMPESSDSMYSNLCEPICFNLVWVLGDP